MDFGARPIVRVHGISWWSHLLPPRARARLVADCDRETLPDGARIDMPDGTAWTARRVLGRPARISWRARRRRGLPWPAWLRGLRAIPLAGRPLAWMVCEVDSWLDILTVAFAWGRCERIEVDQVENP